MLKFQTATFNRILKPTLAWLAVSFVSVAAWANPLVMGRWASIQDLGNMKYALALQVQETQSSLAVTCSQGSRSVTAQITVPTRLTDKKLIVTRGASDTKKLGNIDCTVQLQPMEFLYRLQGNNKLILTAQGQSLVFDRVSASTLEELMVEDLF